MSDTQSRKSYLSTAIDLMRMHTTHDNTDALHEAVRYVKRFFSNTEAHIQIYDHKGKPAIVVSTPQLESQVSTEELRTFDIILLGHLDVVPGGKAMFDPVIENGKLIGRGSVDMKGPIAVMMHLMKDMLEGTVAHPHTALMLTTDEEVGGHAGAGYLVNELGYRATVVLDPDGGEALDDLIIRNKGIMMLKVSAAGKAAHGARPWLGENAIDKAVDACQRIKEGVESFTSEHTHGDEEWHDDEDEHWHNTCTLGMISGGTATNQVPDEAHAYLDVRYTERTHQEALYDKIEELADGCSVHIVADGSVSNVPRDDVSVKLYQDTVRDILGMECRFGRAHGSDDSRFFTRKGIPAIVSVPRSGGRHSEEEWVDVASLEDFDTVYRAFLARWKA